MEISIFEALRTGGDAAIFALLFMLWKQSQLIGQLKERIIKLETHIDLTWNVNNATGNNQHK